MTATALGTAPSSDVRPHVAAGPPAPSGEAGWCAVRVHGPSGAVDVSVPAALSVAEVVEWLRSRLLPGAPLGGPGQRWSLHRLGEPALAPDALLADAGLHDGDTLHLGASTAPAPARAVDDGLVGLARAAGAAGRWSPTAARRALAVAVGVAGTLAAVLALGLLPGNPLPALAVAGLLLVASVLLRRRDVPPTRPDPGRDLPAAAAALAAVPSWVAAGVVTADAVGGDTATRVVLAATAVTVGAALAALCVPGRVAWWVALGASGLSASAGGALVAGDVATPARAGAVVATVWLVGLAAAPWVLTRSRVLLDPDPLAPLPARARRVRGLVDALAVAGALVVVAGLVPAVDGGDGVGAFGPVLGVVVALASALRARRSRFVVESSAGYAAGLVLLAVCAVVAFRDGPAGLRVVLLVAAAALALGLAAVAAATAGGDGDRPPGEAAAWWDRPRTRRTLGVLETAAFVAVLPLLAGVLGLYASAADAGSGLLGS